MSQRENSNVVGLDSVEHRICPSGRREDQFRPYLAAGKWCRFGKLTNLHDRGLYRGSEFKAGAWPLGFDKIDCGLKFVLG
jgi:hypothetical protein